MGAYNKLIRSEFDQKLHAMTESFFKKDRASITYLEINAQDRLIINLAKQTKILESKRLQEKLNNDEHLISDLQRILSLLNNYNTYKKKSDALGEEIAVLDTQIKELHKLDVK